MIFTRLFAATLLGASVLSIALPAVAQPTKKDDAYGYIFTDDKLMADRNDASGSQITVLRLGRRDRLLRPRVHFIAEMLKSVENM